MPDARSRWSDDRLDDLALTVRSLHGLPNRMVEIEARMAGLEDDMHETRDGIAALIRRLDLRDEERKAEKAKEREERRQDRRVMWQVCGALLTAIIAATSVIVAAGLHP